MVLSRMSSAGIIPAELARRLGCTDQNVALLLTPGRDYKLSTMERIAAALGFQFTLSDFEDGTGSGNDKAREDGVGRKGNRKKERRDRAA